MARPVRIAILADARQAKGELKSFEKETGRIGSALKTGLAIGAAAAGAGLVKMFSDGVKAAEDYLTLQRKTAAVIKSTGNAAKISVKGVAKLAGELESLSGIDEDLIINSQNVLATFTSVRNGVKKSDRIFDQATATIVDMSAALGTDLQGATIQVGKALNDPVKGITALSRVGVSFTKSQKDQIKALVESGQTMKAQKLILAELNKEFGGAAKAAGGTGFTGALNRAKDAFGDLNRDILIGVLPTLTKVADWFRLKVVPAVGEFAESVRTQLIPGIKRAFKLVSDKLPPIDISKAFKAGSKRAKEWVQPIIDSFEVGARTGNYGALGLTLGEKVGDAITGVTGKLGAAFSKVDWVQLGKDVGRTALPFIIGFVNALFDPLFDGQFWSKHWTDVALFAISFIPIGKGASFAGRIAEKLGLQKGITGAIIKGLEGAAGALAGGITKTVKFIGGNFARGFGAAFPEVTSAVGGFASRAAGGLKGFVAQAKLFGGGQPELKLANPISSELSDMRPSLLPNLIAAAGRKMDRGFADMMLAEVGHAYAGDQPKDETLRAAGIRRGAFTGRNVHGGARAVDAFDAKADALAVLEAAGAPVATLQVVAGAPAWFHPGRSGTLQMGPQNKLGFFGEIHPRVLAAMDVKGPLVAFELILNAIPGSKAKGATRAALVTSDLMPLSRDFAFVVDDKVEAEKLVKAAKSADKALISDVTVFDLYKLEGGKTSLAIEVTLQPREKTLTEAEIEAVSAKIVQAVTKATGGTLRS